MKKCFYIVLIVTFCNNIFGYRILFSALQQIIHKEIKQQLSGGFKEENITIIKVSINNEPEIRWIRPGKEFRYKGEMYDVVKIKTKNHKKYYYCICDMKEKQLIANYHKMNKRRKNTDKKMKRGSHIQLFFHYNNTDLKLFPSGINYAQHSFWLLKYYPAIPSPPPKTG